MCRSRFLNCTSGNYNWHAWHSPSLSIGFDVLPALPKIRSASLSVGAPALAPSHQPNVSKHTRRRHAGRVSPTHRRRSSVTRAAVSCPSFLVLVVVGCSLSASYSTSSSDIGAAMSSSYRHLPPAATPRRWPSNPRPVRHVTFHPTIFLIRLLFCGPHEVGISHGLDAIFNHDTERYRFPGPI